MKRLGEIFAMVALGFTAFACSTTRALPEGQYRLAKNTIEITNPVKTVSQGDLQSYVLQKPSSWSPMAWVYNWAPEESDTKWANFVHKIGIAPVVYNPSKVESSAKNLEERLKYLGWYNSHVNTDVTKSGKNVKVKYIVTLGNQYFIDSLDYVLAVSDEFAEDFMRDTANVTVRPGDPLSEAALEAETERGEAYYNNIGYYRFSKNHYVFVADTLDKDGKASVQMKVNEYTRNETPEDARPLKKYSFGKVDILYPKRYNFNEKFLRNLNIIHPGDPYSDDEVDRAYSRFSAVKAFGNVNIELTEADSSKVDCAINISPSSMQGMKFNLEGSVNSSGLFGISPSISYYHKNIFHGGEYFNLGFLGNFQFNPKDKVRSTEFGFNTGITFPRFIGLPYHLFQGVLPNTEVKFSLNYQSRPEYTRSLAAASFGYTGNHKRLYYQVYPFNLNMVRVYNMDEEFFQKLAVSNPYLLYAFYSHFDLGSTGTLYFTTDPSVNPTSSYQYARLQVGFSGNVLSLFKSAMKKDENGAGMVFGTPFSQYARAELTLGRTWVFGKNNNLALASRVLAGAGYAYGNSKTLPLEQRFYGGGANSLRGWQIRSVGPGLSKQDLTFSIPNQSGDIKLEGNLEFRYPLVWKLDGALFVDAGNVWTFKNEEGGDEDSELGVLTGSNFLKSIAADWGTGIRLDLTFLIIRLDLGMRLHDPAREDGDMWLAPSQWLQKGNFAVHFGVGYPF